ncbi:MAG: hypothetical protein WC485_05695, partial [Opitutaceae bacterium]
HEHFDFRARNTPAIIAVKDKRRPVTSVRAPVLSIGSFFRVKPICRFYPSHFLHYPFKWSGNYQ